MAWLRRLLFLLFLPMAAYGQGSRYDNFVLKPLNTGGLTSVSGALITVCTSAGTGTPCTPKVTNIYSDEALTTPLTGTGGAGTTNSDSGGNFGFYASPGSYIVTVTGTGIASYTIKLTLPVSSSAKTLNGIQFADQYSTTSTVAAPVNSANTSQATTGGSVAANTYQCEVTFNGASGGETTPSPPVAGEVSSGATSVLYCIHTEYPPPAGALTYNVYWRTGNAGNYFAGHSGIALNLQDTQTATPATSGVQPPGVNTAIAVLPTVQTATGSPGTEIIPSTVSVSAGAPGMPLSGQTFLDYRHGTILTKITDGHPWIVNAPGNFTARTAQGIMNFAANGCNPETEFRQLFTGQNAVQGVNGCITIPTSSTTFQTNSLAGYVNNQSGAATAGVAIYGGARATVNNNGRVWGINTIATDVAGVPTNGIYGAEFDTNTNNATSIAHGVLSQILMNVQPTDSRAFEVGNPQQGAGCSPNCYWPYGLYFNTGATHAPLPANGGLSAILFNPVNSGLNQASQGMAFASFDPVSGTNYSSINQDASGNLLFQMGKGGGLFLSVTANSRALTAKGDGLSNETFEIIDTHAAGHTFDIGSMAATGVLSFRDLSVASGPTVDFDLNGVTNGARSTLIGSATASRNYTLPNASGTFAFNPPAATGTDLGSTALPWQNFWIGTAATNNFKFQPAATSGARIITMADPLSPTTVGLPFTIANGTSTLTANAALAAVTSQAAITTAGTGILTTDTIEWSYASAPTAGDSLCHVSPYVTAGNVNFVRTNPTAAAQNVSAIVINWRVVR